MTLIDAPAPGGLTFPDGGDPDLYSRLLRAAPRTGRCPVWCGATRWFGAVPVPLDVAGTVAAVPAAAVLARWWPGTCPQGGLVRPGTVDRATRRTTLAQAAAFAAGVSDFATLGVVDATRPADVPLALGWSGALVDDARDLVSLCAVLRSWEERFGAVLVWVGGATLVLSVADPPRTRVEAARVAAEHVALCPDRPDGGDGRALVRARTWRFSWDR
jgi:hypothetical protein